MGDDGEVIIDAENMGYIFHFVGNDVIFNNITFKNGIGDFGGAVSLEDPFSKQHAVFNDCTFINNHARYGGAVFVNTIN